MSISHQAYRTDFAAIHPRGQSGRPSGDTALHREGVALEPSPTKPTEPRLGTERAWRWIQSPTKANLTDVAVISPPSRHRGAQAAVGDDGQPRIPGGARHAHPRGGPARAAGVPARPPLHACGLGHTRRFPCGAALARPGHARLYKFTSATGHDELTLPLLLVRQPFFWSNAGMKLFGDHPDIKVLLPLPHAAPHLGASRQPRCRPTQHPPPAPARVRWPPRR